MNLKTSDLLLCDDLDYGDWGLFSWHQSYSRIRVQYLPKVQSNAEV